MNIPEELKYSKEHEWIRPEGTTATVGITDYAQNQLGDIAFIDIRTEGETLEQNEMFGAIEAVKATADAFMPVSGKVTEINALLDSKPEAVNNDPYGEGWLIRIEMTDPAELDGLMDAAEYQAYLG
jgi:glycine cleavage system H protein